MEKKKKYKSRNNKLLLSLALMILFSIVLVGCRTTTSVAGIPQPHNLTLMGNASGYVELTQLVNTNLMDGFFGDLMLITIFAISFMALVSVTGNSLKAFATSSFITFIMSIFLRGINLVQDQMIYISLAILVISVIFLIRSD